MNSLNVNSRFSTLPSVDLQRSKFTRPHKHLTTMNAGELVPIFVDEVLPGDTFSLDMASLVRMSTPIFPVMDNAYLETFFFFVPNRLVWEHWREFNGENSSGYWAQDLEYQIPQLTVQGDLVDKGSIADYMGLPTGVDNISVSALPYRAYCLIWNEWFRDQNTMPPCNFSKSDQGYTYFSRTTVENIAQSSEDSLFDVTLLYALSGARPLPVSKYHDYFTSTLPSPQKGPAVELPIFNEPVPVITLPYDHPSDTVEGDAPLNFKFTNYSNNNGVEGNYAYHLNLQDDSRAGHMFTYLGLRDMDSVQQDFNVYPSNLYVDNNNLIAMASISQLRQAFQLQRLFERDARGGTRYREILKSHFGVDSPDSRMQIPEYLGGKRIPINIDQVLQTSATNEVSPQGNTAAFSLTSDVDSSFTKSFTEHGYIIGVACIRTDHTYQQGIERFWSRKNRFDFYWPTLAHISEQAVLVKEIYATGGEHDDDAFGYQEAWADYRYKPNRVSGAFRSNYAQSLDSWHYADFYEGGNDNFVLNGEWLAETPVNVDRTLAVSSSLEDQFICDFYFQLDCVRVMPLYSVPGLIDHF